MSVLEDIQLIKAVLAQNKDRWSKSKTRLRRLRALYGTRFWAEHADQLFGEDAIKVETADAYSFVESFVASLYTRAPSVEVAHDASSTGNPAMTKECVNSFLHRQREEQERATRLALIYPFAFFKMAPAQSTDLLNRVTMRACPPWESLLDLDADRWSEQRWVGHNYFLTLPEAQAIYGKKKLFRPRQKAFFFGDENRDHSTAGGAKKSAPPVEHQYIQVIELWCFQQDRLLVWSPDFAEGQRLLQREKIPLRDYDDQPMSTIVPLYYASEPDNPLLGYSTLGRSYDQFVEKNVFRTFMANSIRRNTRQYLARKGALNPEELAKLTSGIDGAIAEYEGSDDLSQVLRELDKSNLSTDYDKHLQYMDADMSRSSLLAPFTKGEATKATATEVTALASYSASEIGRLARQRDSSIEMLAHVVTRIYHLYADDGEKGVVIEKGTPVVVTTEGLDGRFRYTALDQASTPLSDALKRQQFLALLPNLQTVGIPIEKLREHMVREFDLPDDFLDVAEPVEDPARLKNVDRSIVPTPPGGTTAELLSQSLQGGSK
tara:strand:- start:342 stop:1985 length:1644 start_codon:yes stop_codon:yes gene_type:complete